jgi:hypothetical protein
LLERPPRKFRPSKSIFFRLTSCDISPTANLVPRVTEAFIWRLPLFTGTYTAKFAGVAFNFIINQASDVFLEVVNNNGHAIIAEVYKVVAGETVYSTESIGLGNGASANWQTIGIERQEAGPPPVQPFGVHPNDIISFKIQTSG